MNHRFLLEANDPNIPILPRSGKKILAVEVLVLVLVLVLLVLETVRDDRWWCW